MFEHFLHDLVGCMNKNSSSYYYYYWIIKFGTEDLYRLLPIGQCIYEPYLNDSTKPSHCHWLRFLFAFSVFSSVTREFDIHNSHIVK